MFKILHTPFLSEVFTNFYFVYKRKEFVVARNGRFLVFVRYFYSLWVWIFAEMNRYEMNFPKIYI